MLLLVGLQLLSNIYELLTIPVFVNEAFNCRLRTVG